MVIMGDRVTARPVKWPEIQLKENLAEGGLADVVEVVQQEE